MRNGKSSPYYQSGNRPFYMQNTNPIDMIGNSDLNTFADSNNDEKINYDSNNDEASDDFDGFWSNTKWTN